jgi:hypothetical protein
MAKPRLLVSHALRALLCLCVCALAVTAHAAKPPVRDALTEAQACYGAGDLACVLRVLGDAAVTPAQESEKFRLLAFAAARLDQHEAARKHFAAWVQLAPTNRLERATTPPGIFQDYCAALLAAQSDALEWAPQVENQPVLPAVAVTPSDLPRFAPPGRIASDLPQRITYLLGLHGSLPTVNDWGPPQAHLGLALGIELELAHGLRAGILAGGWQRPDKSVFRWNPYTLFRAGIGTRWGDHGLDLLLGAGVALDTGDDSVVGALAPALRYHWRPADRSVGFFSEIASQTLFGSKTTTEVIGITLGVLLRPGSH